jgi:AcrR family transcriptional regulator
LFKFKHVFNLRLHFNSMSKKDQIIDKAIELFGNKGFDNTSIRELCHEAGINIAMINYYFGSKDKLFLAMVERKAVYMKGKMEELLANDEMEPMEKVKRVVEEYVNRMFSHPAYHRILYREMMLNMRPEMHKTITSIFGTNTQKFKQIIEQGIKKKVFRKVDPELTMASMIGTINQVTLSGPLCSMLLNKEEGYDPYSDESFRKRVIKHLQGMMESHLLVNYTSQSQISKQ